MNKLGLVLLGVVGFSVVANVMDIKSNQAQHTVQVDINYEMGVKMQLNDLLKHITHVRSMVKDNAAFLQLVNKIGQEAFSRDSSAYKAAIVKGVNYMAGQLVNDPQVDRDQLLRFTTAQVMRELR
jgi:hypothetical protein